ncbi:MAG: helix-hairpin-helix domain-containing protein [Kineothrix sp.]
MTGEGRVNLKKVLGLFLILTALLAASGCSRETVVLDAEDLVLLEETGVHEAEENKGNGSGEETEAAEERVEESTLFVHICGEVAEPGVYELPEGSRIYEAVEAAGGFTEAAEPGYVNLAQVLADGQQVEIPDRKSAAGIKQQEAAADHGLVDINTAGKPELCTLPGIGESRAESIIAYREKNGGFARIEDIMKVEGIKEGMFARIKDKICVRGVR